MIEWVNLYTSYFTSFKYTSPQNFMTQDIFILVEILEKSKHLLS